jgi:squalene-associated FAD-dependent desaturase
MSRMRVAVIGGGLAGITAALDCAQAGADVVLLESRGRLGGAAYSFTREGLHLDNGQHVFLRCCTAYTGLLERLEATELVTMQSRLRIPVLAPGGRRAQLARSELPAPLHLARSLLGYDLLSRRERLSVARAMAALRRVNIDDPACDGRAFGDWLTEHGQSPDAVAALWELIVRPTVNLVSADASLAQAAQVFQVGLLHDTKAADVGYARVPLSDIHDTAAQRALASAGVDIRLRRGVSAIAPGPDGFAVEVRGAPTVHADRVVLATSPGRAAGLLPPRSGPTPAQLAGLGRSPIVNLHVVLDRRLLEEPFAAAVHSPLQWLFDRTESSGVRRGQYLAITLSAADAELAMSADELRERALPALFELLGDRAGVDAFFVTREHAATFRAAPGARTLRPPARTAIAGLALAGAWTATGWPATMEGAVRSGHAAADVVLESRGPRARRPARARPSPVVGASTEPLATGERV